MKKIFRTALSLAAAAAASLCLCISSFAASIYFEDNAELYTDEQEKILMQEQQELCDYTGWNIAVITTDIDFPEDGYEAIEYAESRYKEIYGSYSASGILYLIDTGYRQFSIGGDPDVNYFNDARVRNMIERCNEKYYDYDDMGNVETYFECVREVYDKGGFKEEEKAASAKTGLAAGAVGGLAAAGIGIGIVISRYKFHSKTSATNYVRQGGVDMYRNNDIYLRETVTKTRIERDSGGSGGGGGGHGSSGGHSMGGGGSGGHR